MATWRLDPDVVHLNHGSFGACPVEVLGRQQTLRDEMEANPVGFMLRRYQPALEESRAALSAFVGADADGLVFVPNATYGVNSALRSIEERLGEGDELLVTNHTYLACRLAVEVTARRTGAELVVVDVPFPTSGPDEAAAAVLGAVTERTAVVLLDHVTSPTALVLPIEEIVAALAPAVTVIVDGAHAPGMIEVEVASLGVDFYTANCHKWICSPKGAGFLWVAEPYRETAVAASVSLGYDGGWPGSGSRFHARFDWTGTDDPTARLCVAAALETMGAHRPDGWAGIRRSNRELVLEGRQVLLDALGVATPAPDSMIGSIAAVPVPAAVIDGLDESRPLNVALHEDWSIEVPAFAWPAPPDHLIRVSAQQYNTIDDYRALATALTSIGGR